MEISEIHRELVNRSDQMIIHVANHEIMDAMAPFTPGLVTYELLYSGMDRRIRIQCSTLVDDIFETSADDIMLMDTYAIGGWLGSQAGEFFRGLMNEPVPDNVILGCD